MNELQSVSERLPAYLMGATIEAVRQGVVVRGVVSDVYGKTRYRILGENGHIWWVHVDQIIGYAP
jgi:hypothetical protein